MKKEFSGYYELDAKDVTRLWEEAVVVFDTNVLLHTYRVPKKTREQLLSILKKIKNRIWIPYQVGVEYQRNRISVLRDEFGRSKGIVDEVRKLHGQFLRTVRDLDMKERGVGAEVDAELQVMEKAAEALFGHLKKGMDGHVAPGEEDPILGTLTTLFDGRVGPRPTGQEEVDALYEKAQRRYAAKMGPGFMDESKAGDLYQVDGIIYDRQYGDYLLWSQLLAFVKANKQKDIIFVTSDVKQDWWLDTKSKSGIRPLPELCMEMSREGGAERFWMYTLHEFMAESNRHLDARVTQQALDDVKIAELESSIRKHDKFMKWDFYDGDEVDPASAAGILIAVAEMKAVMVSNTRKAGSLPVAKRKSEEGDEHFLIIDLDRWSADDLGVKTMLLQHMLMTVFEKKKFVGIVCFAACDGRSNTIKDVHWMSIEEIRNSTRRLSSLTLLGIRDGNVVLRQQFSTGQRDLV